MLFFKRIFLALPIESNMKILAVIRSETSSHLFDKKKLSTPYII